MTEVYSRTEGRRSVPTCLLLRSSGSWSDHTLPELSLWLCGCQQSSQSAIPIRDSSKSKTDKPFFPKTKSQKTKELSNTLANNWVNSHFFYYYYFFSEIHIARHWQLDHPQHGVSFKFKWLLKAVTHCIWLSSLLLACVDCNSAAFQPLQEPTWNVITQSLSFSCILGNGLCEYHILMWCAVRVVRPEGCVGQWREFLQEMQRLFLLFWRALACCVLEVGWQQLWMWSPVFDSAM